MNERLRAVLSDLEKQGRENDARETDRSRKMLNLDPGTARLISILVRSSGAAQILEVGTSNGYSTIWLAWSLDAEAGRRSSAVGERADNADLADTSTSSMEVLGESAACVVSIDRNPAKHELARENLRRAQLLDRVELRLGDSTAIIRELAGPFDAVFFDADRTLSTAQLQLLLPKLSPRVLVLHDNALSHPEEIADYLKLVESLPDFEHTVVPVGKGLSVAFRG